MSDKSSNKISLDDNLEKFSIAENNLGKIEALYARLISAMQKAPLVRPELHGHDGQLFMGTMMKAWSEAFTQPQKFIETQYSMWQESMNMFAQMQQSFLNPEAAKPDDPAPKDRRFAHPMWQSNPYFAMIKQQYFKNAELMRQSMTAGAEELSERDQKRLGFFTEQIIDMIAPTNFLATNPEALSRAVETEGQSLVQGLENLIADIERNNGLFNARLSDMDAFEVGKTIAYTQGAVVHRTALYELIEYTPSTDVVYEVPLILFPPWINKYYILDLQSKNSLIKWLVDQGYRVFIVSWVNPEPQHHDIGMLDYIEQGYIDAISTVRDITGKADVNALGYCIAGTTLQLALSYMKHKGFEPPLSATFLTTLNDFSNHGEFTAFLHDEFIDGIERQVATDGVLNAYIMSRTMSYLRANDLVYAPAVRNYLLGDAPPAFDLLYWNEDGANLPARMTMEYLRQLCQQNAFVTDGVHLEGAPLLKVTDVDIPIYYLTCEADHIAPWMDCYMGYVQTKSKDRRFVLAQSGHVAGVVNPASRKKYGHYTSDKDQKNAQSWKEHAQFNDMSWWVDFDAWLGPRSGAKIPSQPPGTKSYPVIEPAPGTYVKRKAVEIFAAMQKNP